MATFSYSISCKVALEHLRATSPTTTAGGARACAANTMASPLPSKTIAKLPLTKDKRKCVPPLSNLCTKALWKQSIEAGKAEELVAALRATPEGLRALVADAEAHFTQVFVVNLASGDGVTEGTCGYVKITAETAWFFKLLAEWTPDAVPYSPDHPLGGDDLRWDEVGECVDWMRKIVEDMDTKTARSFLLDALNIEVPKRDEDGQRVEDVTEWLAENYEDWADQFEEKFQDLFNETLLREKYMLSADETRMLRKGGFPPRIQGVVSINLDNWG